MYLLPFYLEKVRILPCSSNKNSDKFESAMVLNQYKYQNFVHSNLKRISNGANLWCACFLN